MTSADGTCSNGVPGIESLDKTVCCDSRCEDCGGAGCGDTVGLSGEDCCTADIELKNEVCSDKKSSPCVMDDDPGELLMPGLISLIQWDVYVGVGHSLPRCEVLNSSVWNLLRETIVNRGPNILRKNISI